MNKIITKIYLIICAFVFLYSCIYSQPRYIDIRDFKGVFTNADLEDILPEYFVVMQNLRPVYGKLVKTFGFGDIGWDSNVGVDNFAVYINSHLTNPSGVRYFAYTVMPVPYDTLILEYWDTSTNDWEQLSLDQTYYHNNGINPVIQADGVIRFLAGNVGEVDGNEAKGVWYGYVDRKFFDEGLTAQGFIVSQVPLIQRPEIDASVYAKLDSGSFTETKYYKYSWIYDGNQESLLSNDGLVVDYLDGQYGILKFPFSISGHTWRITGLNIYRSDNQDGIYHKIQTLDFLRTAEDSCLGSPDNTAYNGEYRIYVPHSNFTSYAFDVVNNSYEIDIGGTLIKLMPNMGSGQEIVKVDYSERPLQYDIWNTSWTLYADTGSGSYDYEVASGSDSAFASKQMVITNIDMGNRHLSGAYIFLDKSTVYSNTVREIRIADKVFGKAIHFVDTLTLSDADSTLAKPWHLLESGNGLYWVDKRNDYANYYFLDAGLLEGVEHPYPDEVSLKVNGKFAQIIGNRLWQANIVLDPGGKNEVHEDWVSYSEIGKYDVNPVSNVISFANRGAGEITGLAELLGNPVILKKNNISIINIRSNPTNPALWNIIESVYNIGNIAPYGYITVLGDLYVCYYDGIYKFSPNDLAESANTPSKKLKITTPIEDIYLNLTLSEKENIRSAYNQKYNEIIFLLGDNLWAYNISENYWRQIKMAISFNPIIMVLDDTANVIVYNSSDNKFYSSNIKGDTRIDLITKTFAISDERNEPVQYLWVTHKETPNPYSDPQVYVYINNDSTVSKTLSLTSSDTLKTEKLYIGQRCKKFRLRFYTIDQDKNDFELHRIKIQYEGNQ